MLGISKERRALKKPYREWGYPLAVACLERQWMREGKEKGKACESGEEAGQSKPQMATTLPSHTHVASLPLSPSSSPPPPSSSPAVVNTKNENAWARNFRFRFPLLSKCPLEEEEEEEAETPPVHVAGGGVGVALPIDA